jgi:hypothetical protein
MKRYLLHCLKAGLIGLMFIPFLLWAADSPRVSVDQSPVGANKADIGFTSVINGDNHMDIVISSGSGQGCSAGQFWDIGMGGCTSAIKLRSVSVSQACDCSCPGTGSCSASQSGSYDVFGWRLPTDGHELVSYNGPTSWGACSVTSNNCQAAPPPDSGGGGGGGTASVGDVYKITAMICSGAESDYYTAPADTPVAIRNQIISQYRSWEGGRCPEASGYMNWVKYVNDYAYQYWAPNPGVPDAMTYQRAYDDATYRAIDAGADQTGEKTAAGLAAANHLCQLEANNRFGPTAQATYVAGSGNQCVVTVP